jgi:hypothetical protein
VSDVDHPPRHRVVIHTRVNHGAHHCHTVVGPDREKKPSDNFGAVSSKKKKKLELEACLIFPTLDAPPTPRPPHTKYQQHGAHPARAPTADATTTRARRRPVITRRAARGKLLQYLATRPPDKTASRFDFSPSPLTLQDTQQLVVPCSHTHQRVCGRRPDEWN